MFMRKKILIFIIFLAIILSFIYVSQKTTTHETDQLSIALVGDFGTFRDESRAVAKSIAFSSPDFIISTGDNNYESPDYDLVVGGLYEKFVLEGRFYPATGNHDYEIGIENYDKYFGFIEKNRFYTVSLGSIDFFILDSQNALFDEESNAIQKIWLESQKKRSTAIYKIVVLHHPPFTSGKGHGSNEHFQWNFKGFDVVISGHEHVYERLELEGTTYIVNGVGGRELHSCGSKVENSIHCIDNEYGYVLISEHQSSLNITFKNSENYVLDSFKIFQKNY